MTPTSDKQKNDSVAKNNDEILITNYEIGCHPQINIFGLRLADAEGKHTVSVKIGYTDAQVFGLKLPERPSLSLTFYDIIRAILEAQKVTVQKVVVHDRVEGRFISQLYLTDANRNSIVIESVVTNTVALAFIMHAPIYAKKKVFDLANDIKDNEIINWYDIDHDYTVSLLNRIPAEDMDAARREELETCLNIAVGKENYELAEKLRRVIQQKIKP
ncbi:MAG: bifunctional nuclease family protein [Tannerella sp.]|jgi:bifunctional DNase/RNase|nr:bifunctional nuclease family protein [Tannerella sp.]